MTAVFKSTNLWRRVLGNDRTYFPTDNFYILGGVAFGISIYLLTPFRNTGNLSDTQMRHSKRLLEGRVVENSFAFLKDRFRRLKFIDTDVQRLPNIIKACCVIYNVALQYSDDVQFLESKIPLNLLPDDGAGFNVTINHVESLLKEGYNKKE